ncbi:hypothetical protein E6C48_01555 [Mesorhizobium composti]|uniref:Uncharacterized protein n=1 Tax=Ollibium composti TaxID=2675109 RepID=A0ABY2QCF6_9HYPH|nr:hypothetical protein E6C48_01555 [Mesorhizobium composti]
MPDTHGRRLQTLRRHRLRYARPDPERGRCVMSASQSVLQAHRYRVVSESLSKPKFVTFIAANFRKSGMSFEVYAASPRRKLMMPEKSVPAPPCALKSA